MNSESTTAESDRQSGLVSQTASARLNRKLNQTGRCDGRIPENWLLPTTNISTLFPPSPRIASTLYFVFLLPQASLSVKQQPVPDQISDWSDDVGVLPYFAASDAGHGHRYAPLLRRTRRASLRALNSRIHLVLLRRNYHPCTSWHLDR